MDSWGKDQVYAGHRVTGAPSTRRLPLRFKDIWLSGSRLFWSGGYSFKPVLLFPLVFVFVADIRPPESFNILANLQIFCLASLVLRVIPQTFRNVTPGTDNPVVRALPTFSFLSFTTKVLLKGMLNI